MTLLVAMFVVTGCVDMLESVFFLNVEVFGVNDLSKMWSLYF